MADAASQARLDAETQLQGRMTRIREQEAMLRDEMALVRQQQLIHDRMVDDIAKARADLEACQAELRTKHEVRFFFMALGVDCG